MKIQTTDLIEDFDLLVSSFSSLISKFLKFGPPPKFVEKDDDVEMA